MGGNPLEGRGLVERHGDRVYVFNDDEAALRGAVGEIGLRAAQLRPTSLEDVFLKMTGRGINE